MKGAISVGFDGRIRVDGEIVRHVDRDHLLTVAERCELIKEAAKTPSHLWPIQCHCGDDYYCYLAEKAITKRVRERMDAGLERMDAGLDRMAVRKEPPIVPPMPSHDIKSRGAESPLASTINILKSKYDRSGCLTDRDIKAYDTISIPTLFEKATQHNPCNEIVLNINNHRSNTMSNASNKPLNFQAIIALAEATNNDDLNKYSVLPAELAGALKKKMMDRRAEKIDAAADAVIELLDRNDQAIQTEVQIIRNARAAEKCAKERIASLERACAYGMSTQNFVPLTAELGWVSATSALSSVPADFVMPKQPVKK